MALSLTSTPESRREAGLDRPEASRGRWRHFFRLVGSYWVSEDWKFAWIALAVNIATLFTGVYSFVLMNNWQGNFFDAVGAANGRAIPGLLVDFMIALAVAIGYSAVATVAQGYLTIRWRNWLSNRYIERWLRHQRFHDIERARLIDNPDQRIAEDIDLLTSGGFALFSSFLLAVTSAITFGIVLWNLSGVLAFTVAGYLVALPGTLVWAALGYALFSGIIIIAVGSPLIRRTMRQQHYEADFRFNLIHVRRNSEQIAFAGSSSAEWRGLTQAFALIRHNFIRLTWIRTGVDATQQSITQANQVIPVLLMMPQVIARQATLGAVMQARDAYQQFGSAVNWLIQAYPAVAAMIANINRIKALDDAIDHPRPYRIGKNQHSALTIQTRNLALDLPNGEHLLTVGDWTIEPGERWTIQGASGTGKSTLLRALAGIWPDGEGEVALPSDQRIMFVPQRAYFPIGTLKDAICFPGNANATDDADVIGLLELCRLPHLGDILHEIKPWVDVLSPGEQQRLAMARVLLHRPDYLFLDEATSALDADNAGHLYASIIERLPRLTLVSVVHAEALHRFHTHNFCIVDRRAVIDA